MPTYELALVLRQMTRPEIISTLKRTANKIYDKNGIIRNLENLGHRKLPHKLTVHGLVHKEGNFFILKFDTAPNNVEDLTEEFNRDIDIIRKNIFKLNERKKFDCTLHDENLPPAYRKDVQNMIDIANKKRKVNFKYNSGLNYYPFQK